MNPYEQSRERAATLHILPVTAAGTGQKKQDGTDDDDGDKHGTDETIREQPGDDEPHDTGRNPVIRPPVVQPDDSSEG